MTSASVVVFALASLLPLQVKPPHLVCNDGLDARIPHPEGAYTTFLRGWGPSTDGFAASMAPLPVAGEERATLLLGQPFIGKQTLWAVAIDEHGNSEYLHRIAPGEGGFTGDPQGSQFGTSLALLDDLDGDGHADLAVGDPGGGGSSAIFSRGAVWLLFLDGTGHVAGQQEISATAGGFSGVLQDGDGFGAALAWLGDLDGDGTGELAVSATGDDDGGAVWILFLRPDGTVRTETKISTTAGGFQGVVQLGDGFGRQLAALPDLDGDGRRELAVAAPADDDGLAADVDSGAIWILFVEADGSVREHRRVAPSTTSFGAWGSVVNFGRGLGWVADDTWPHDGRLGVTTRGSIDGLPWHLWLLELDAAGEVASHEARPLTYTGLAVLSLEDLDGNGLVDLATTISGWALSCSGHTCTFSANFVQLLWGRDGSEHLPQLETTPEEDAIGPVALVGDLDGNGWRDLAVGEPGDDDGDFDSGAVWIQSLDAHGEVLESRKISQLSGGFLGALQIGDGLGSSLADLGDLDGDGVGDLAAGAPLDDHQGSPDLGSVWILLLHSDGTVEQHLRLDKSTPGLATLIHAGDGFGSALAAVDLDGDGRRELIASAPYRDVGGAQTGLLYVLFLEPDGTLRSVTTIGNGAGGFSGTLPDGAQLGWALAALGDLDGDGLTEIAASQPTADDGGVQRGAVWILSLDAAGQVARQQTISQTSGRFGGQLVDGARFGSGLCAPGDLDADGVADLLVIADPSYPAENDVWLLLLTADGAVRDEHLLAADDHPFYSHAPTVGRAAAVLEPDPLGHRPLLLTVFNGYWRLCLGLGTWADLGQGLAGAGGLVPQLAAHGFQLPGEPVTFALQRARRGSTAALVFGLSELGAPFAGGTLVPAPDVLALGLPVDAAGELEQVLRWPPWSALPPGTQVWAQAWVVDDDAPFGLSASNAVLGSSP